ncbi:hypothetical protein [Roseimicrobium sp. ORNL1]|uniref:hypothetical protein n=1 Tax=Roseimicrobium sp. ORNL1 TaxID=2711231 RepID=UPI0013E12DEB|nr:hypothetical protein [Roseimicrobium sp. ORNL1]QIF01717.1 hypothetical protein G5S37_09330 [Roseimicrobium sp. ORNL1]
MDEATHIENPTITREWRRVSSDIPVTLVWAYDTVASLELEDCYDSEAATLPAGQLIMFSQVTEDPHLYLCDLDDPRFVEKAVLPTGRILRIWPYHSATRLQAVIEAEHYDKSTVPATRPSWSERLFRRLAR